ncbi:N-6 DNA methylase [Enterobacter mori]|uniref:N-6 DNA methylase n=1 Tax=Enterobacter mori TaxID=539813 RepID=UPI00402A9EB7
MLDITHYNKMMREFIVNKMSVQLLANEGYSNFLNHDFSDLLVRKSFDKEVMRQSGCFFTGKKLTSFLLASVDKKSCEGAIFLDPTCGLGNLLIEASKSLPVFKELDETLYYWGNHLVGYDIFNEFIEGTKLRVIIEAINRGAKNNCSIEKAMSLIHRIEKKDVMSLNINELKDVTHALLNPPFSNWNSPRTNYWKNGKINSAGIIIDHLIRILPSETKILAILPDVLRSGSRYHEFRKFLECNISGNVEIWGKFSTKTDVDVFIIKGIKKVDFNTPIIWNINDEIGEKLEDHYDISIGPLVAYRHVNEGIDTLYLHQKNSPTGLVLQEICERINFKGRLTKPPFVVIKRTSSPKDKIRASATIINCAEPVAVENHLIILSPKDKSFKKCQELMEILASEITTNYLNDRIRLRHLTISAVKSIPYKKPHL